MERKRKDWEPDPVAEAIITSLEEDLLTYKEIISELEMELHFLRQHASKQTLQKADEAFCAALEKLHQSNIDIVGF